MQHGDAAPKDERFAFYLPVLKEAAEKHDVPLSWLLAIAEIESSFRASAVTMSGGDGKRGGSYGICQMSLKTARALGFAGVPSALLEVRLNADLACSLLKQNRQRFGADNLRDVAAAYNSGKRFSRAPASTRGHYVPTVLMLARGYGWGK